MSDLLQREIDAYLEAHWDEVVADIDELVRVESTEDLAAATEGAPFGPGPREALSRVLAQAARMGLEAHDCAGHIGYADLPGASPVQIGIIGHVDVVAAGPDWHFAPFEVTRKDGYLIGRGVIDDKGPLVVAMHAVKFWKDRGVQLPYTVRILFGANEETAMRDVAYYRERFADPAFLFTPDSQFPVGFGESGIAHGELISKRLEGGDILAFEGGQAPNAVPGQARARVRVGNTDLADGENVFVEVREDGTADVRARGAAAHASTPELGENALGLLVNYLLANGIGTQDERAYLGLLQRLLSCTDGSMLGIACSDEHFGALTAVGSVMRLEGGRLRQTIDFRYPTTTTSDAIAQRLQALAAEVGASFAIGHDKLPFLMDPHSPAVRALLDAYNEATGEGRVGQTSKGGTYAREFTTGVSFGPEKPWEKNPDWVGGMHGPDEGVSENLLKQAFSIYARTLDKLMRLDLA